MANDQQLFLAAELAPDECPQTPQEWANLIARALIPNPDFVNPDVGQKDGIIIGGPPPASDEGPWLPEGETELWFYDSAFAAYFPGGEKAGSMKAIATIDNTPGSRWLLCDGSAVPQVLYPRLFSAIGHYFANPDANGYTGGQSGADAAGLEASGQFRLPDTRGVTIVGAGTQRIWTLLGGTDPLGPSTVGDKTGNVRLQIQPQYMANAGQFGKVYEYDSGTTNADLPRIYGGVHYTPLAVDRPGRNTDADPTADNDRVYMFQPSLVIAFYIRF